jgi:hypothetical protein
MGGRPAFPFEYSYVSREDRGEYAEIIDYWGTTILGQRNEWVYFRRFQRRNRKTPEILAQYQRDVENYRRNEHIPGDIQLVFDAKQQTKLDEWKEYHYFEHQRLVRMREKAEEARLERERAKKKWEQGEGDPKMPAWLYDVRMLAESELDKHMVLLKWIEEQIPKVAQESAPSDREPSRDALNLSGSVEVSIDAESKAAAGLTSSGTNAKNNRRTSRRNKKSASGVLKVAGSPRVMKSRRKTTTRDLRSVNNALSGASHRTPKATEPETSVSIQPCPALRRSQRIIDLAIKRHQPPETIQAAQQTKPSPKSRRDRKPRTSRAAQPSPQLKPQGITKTRPTRKKKPRLAAGR